MKLFKQLLVAPAALGLMAPLAANAAEVNINDVTSYTTPGAEVSTAQFSDVVPGDWAYTALQNLTESAGCVDNVYAESLKGGQSLTRYEAAALVNACLESGVASADLGTDAARLSNEFGTEMAILKGRVDGLEYKVEELSAGSFSSATKLSGSSVFTTGFEDTTATNDNKLTFEYNFKLDLNSSFTGRDNLYAGIETGNQGDLNMDSAVTANNANALELETLFYTFPVGEFSVSAGPLMAQDDIISATTSIYSDAFRLGGMRYGTEGEQGAGAAIEYQNDNGWNGSFNIIAQGADTATTGAFTEEGTDVWTASIGYDAESGNYGGGIIYKDDDNVDTSFGVGVYFRPDNLPTISFVYDQLSDNDATDSSDFLVGLDYEEPFGWTGTLSGAVQTWDNAGTARNHYEVYYNYPVNDSVNVQGGIFFEEDPASTNQDTQGFVVETFFKF